MGIYDMKVEVRVCRGRSGLTESVEKRNGEGDES